MPGAVTERSIIEEDAEGFARMRRCLYVEKARPSKSRRLSIRSRRPRRRFSRARSPTSGNFPNGTFARLRTRRIPVAP